MTICVCGLNKETARKSVTLLNFGGVCHRCGFSIQFSKLDGAYVFDSERGGALVHVFKTTPFMCPSCGNLNLGTQVYCNSLTLESVGLVSSAKVTA